MAKKATARARRSTVDDAALAEAGEKFGTGFEVVRPVGVVPLITIGAGTWAGALERADFAGAFVRLRPPAGVDESEIEALQERCKERGAVAVKIERTREDRAAPRDAEVQAGPVHARARAVVDALVEASQIAEKEALRGAVAAICSEVGL